VLDQFKDAQAITDAVRLSGDFDHGGRCTGHLVVARDQVMRSLRKIVPRTDDLLPRRGRSLIGETFDQIELEVGVGDRVDDLWRQSAPEITAVLQTQIAFAALFARAKGEDQGFADARDAGRQINDQLRQRFGPQIVEAEFDGVGDSLGFMNRGKK
jgi:hypothetical protein